LIIRAKGGKPGGRDEPVEDPQAVQEALRALAEAGVEFPIKVEGTSTLPYASQIQQLQPETGEFILKLVRPLPHELMAGAVFRMVFAVDDQRFEALIAFVRREGYLQYCFSLPEHLFYADRRRSRRYPFRPRENAYVVASDGGIPGLGVAGPLTNIGMGGLCLRVDRVLKLDAGIRIPPGTALFERGSSFPRVRIQDLPRLPILELSGWVAHATEKGDEIVLGLDFRELGEEQARLLGESLAFREKLLQARSGFSPSDSGGIARPEASRTGAAREEEAGPAAEAGELGGPGAEGPLLLLRRKAVQLVLVGPDDGLRARCREGLWRAGYHRLAVAEDPGEACLHWQSGPAPRLVLLTLSVRGEPLAALRFLERESAVLGDVPLAVVCEALDPTLFLGGASAMRFVVCQPDDEAWIGVLDELLGLSGA
jgi:hypothetical protein